MDVAQPELGRTKRRFTFQRLDRFDWLIGTVMMTLSAAIVIVILAGDRAGVGVSLLDPLSETPANSPLMLHSTVPLRLAFSEPMEPISVHLHFDPPLDGKVSWSGTQLTFHPKLTFTPNTTIHVSLDAGAKALNGRTIHETLSWQLQIAPLSVIYLGPARHDRTAMPINLWRVAPPGQPMQLTHSQYGVYDFAPSLDGSRIAFSQKDAAGKTDLFLLDVASGATRQLTRCIDASCRAPAWNPDGNRIIYERGESTRLDSPARAWIVDVATLRTDPLFTDSRWLGKTPRWSPDGKTISLFDADAGGIFLVDAATGDRSFIQTMSDDSGQFAPGDGQALVYRQLTNTPNGALWRLEVAEYGRTDPTIRPLSPPDGTLTNDQVAIWNPDGQRLTVMRRYLDDRFTEQLQIYDVNAATGESQPLVLDPAFAHGAISWSPDGGRLLFQRYPAVPDENATPTLWTYDPQSKTLTQIASDGFLPQWLP